MHRIHRQDLVGSWDLVRYYVRFPDGHEAMPLGADAVGRICYTDEGHMFGFMARARRASFASADRLRATPVEKAQGFDDCVTYAGRWTLREDGMVVHHVELSLLPNWTGQDQLRIPLLDEQGLELVAYIGEGAERRSAVVRWRRSNSTPKAGREDAQGAMSTSPSSTS